MGPQTQRERERERAVCVEGIGSTTMKYHSAGTQFPQHSLCRMEGHAEVHYPGSLRQDPEFLNLNPTS